MKNSHSQGHKRRRFEELFTIPLISRGESLFNRENCSNSIRSWTTSFAHDPDRGLITVLYMQDCNRDWFWKALWLYKRQSRGNGKKKERNRGEPEKKRRGRARIETKKNTGTMSGRPERTQRNKYTDEEGESGRTN